MVKECGKPTRWKGIYRDVLCTQYGIQTHGYGCIVSYGLIEQIRGYNEVSKAAIEQRFGDGFLEKVRIEAEGKYQKEHPQKPDDTSYTNY